MVLGKSRLATFDGNSNFTFVVEFSFELLFLLLAQIFEVVGDDLSIFLELLTDDLSLESNGGLLFRPRLFEFPGSL